MLLIVCQVWDSQKALLLLSHLLPERSFSLKKSSVIYILFSLSFLFFSAYGANNYYTSVWSCTSRTNRCGWGSFQLFLGVLRRSLGWSSDVGRIWLRLMFEGLNKVKVGQCDWPLGWSMWKVSMGLKRGCSSQPTYKTKTQLCFTQAWLFLLLFNLATAIMSSWLWFPCHNYFLIANFFLLWNNKS